MNLFFRFGKVYIYIYILYTYTYTHKHTSIIKYTIRFLKKKALECNEEYNSLFDDL